MKQKFANYFKLGMLLIGFSILLQGCHDDDPHSAEDKHEHLHLHKGRIKDFSKLNSFVKKLKEKPSATGNAKSTSLEQTNGFDIIYNQDMYIQEVDGATTYSIPIYKKNQEAKTFSNLIVKFSDTEPTEAFILNYYPKNEYIQAVKTNPQTPFSGSIGSESINYDGSLDNLQRLGEDCETITIKYCNYGEVPGDRHVGGPNCSVGYYWYENVLVCADDEPTLIDNEAISGGGSAGPTSNNNDHSNAGSSSNTNNTTTQNPIVVPNIPTIYNDLGIDDLPLEMVDWINQPENADFKQEMRDLLDEEDPLTRKELEAYLLIKCEISPTPWEDSTGNFRNIPSLAYTQIRHEIDTQYGYTYTEFKLTDGNTILAGDFAQTYTNGIAHEAEPKPIFFKNVKAERRLYEIPQHYNNYPNIDLDHLWTNFWDGVQTGLRYFTPLEDIKIFIEGTDFDGNAESQAVAGITLIVDNTPFGKVFKIVKKAGELIGASTPIVRRYVNDIYKTQRRLVKKHQPDILTASNTRKGNWGEMATDVDLIGRGYQDLHVNRITDIDTPSASIESLGIDHVFRNPETGQYIIVESKFRTSPINNLMSGIRQMSDDWILGNNRLFDAVGQNQSLFDDIVENGYLRVVSRISPDGTITYKKLNSDGYQILGDAGIFHP